MTKEEVLEYIYSKQIPFSFYIEQEYHELDLYIEGECIVYDGALDFELGYYEPNIEIYCNSVLVFSIKKPTIEECLGDFFFWWEVNKHRCRLIRYYEQ